MVFEVMTITPKTLFIIRPKAGAPLKWHHMVQEWKNTQNGVVRYEGDQRTLVWKISAVIDDICAAGGSTGDL
jgi:hypothetical protein